jgi:hypothetical protein
LRDLRALFASKFLDLDIVRLDLGGVIAHVAIASVG